MTAGVKQLETNAGLSEDGDGRLQKTNKELMRKYGEQKTVAERNIGKLPKCVGTSSVWITKCVVRP